MTKAELVSYVRRMTLASPSDLSDAEIEMDLDAALLELSTFHKWPWLYAEDTITLADSTADYELPEDFSVLEQIVPPGGRGTKLAFESVQKVRDTYGSEIPSGIPVMYYLSGERQVTFVPTPTSSEAGTVYAVHYYKVPDLTAFTSTDEPPFNPAYHLILADKACQFFWEREEKPEVAAAYEARFYRRANAMYQFYITRMPTEQWILGGGRGGATLRRVPSWWPEGD